MPHANIGNLISYTPEVSSTDVALQISSEFANTYEQRYDMMEKYLSVIMALDRPSVKRTETYATLESMPGPDLWRRGDPIPTEGTGSKRYSVTNWTFGKRIKWHREDRADASGAGMGDVLTKFRALANRMALVTSKAAIEMVTGTASLLASIPNAPDGVAGFYATDGDGNARFGVSGGNIVTQTGVTSATITTDFFSCVTRFAAFQDTKGEPFFDPDIGSERYTILASHANIEAFMSAFKAQIIHSTVAGTSTTNVTTGAGVDNLVIASGAMVDIRFSSRLSGNTWYIFRNDAPVPPLFEQVRQPIIEESALDGANNSDEVRNTGYEYLQYFTRKGFGWNVPFGAIKVA